MRFGQLGVAVIAPTCKIVAYAVTCVHPPYPVLPIIFMLSGYVDTPSLTTVPATLLALLILL